MMLELLASVGNDLLVFFQTRGRKLGKFVVVLLSKWQYIVDEINQCTQKIF